MFLVSWFCYVLDKWKVASVAEMGPTPTYKKELLLGPCTNMMTVCFSPEQTIQAASAVGQFRQLVH